MEGSTEQPGPAPAETAAAEPVYPPPKYVEKFVLRGHTKAVSSVKFSPDGKWLLSSGMFLLISCVADDHKAADKTVRKWNIEDGTLEYVYEGHKQV